jgi:hypothetical protein
MRSHTHKRGRRFHRGGVTYEERDKYATINSPGELETKLISKTNVSKTFVNLDTLHPNFTSANDRMNERNYTSPIITLTCQKKPNKFGIPFPAMPQKFSCNISYTLKREVDSLPGDKGDMVVMVMLERTDDDKIGFSVVGTLESVQTRLRDLSTLANIQAEQLGTTGKGAMYSFNFPDENAAMFNAIADVIEKFKDTAIEELKPEQQQQQQQQQSESFS